MAKKSKPPLQSAQRALPKRLREQLAEVDELVEEKELLEARTLLYELDREYPGRVDVVGCLAEVAYDLHDMESYQYACEQWFKLEPANDEVALGLAGAYLSNMRPCLALRAFQNFLKKWPDHPHAPDARQTISGLEEALPGMLAEVGLSGDEGYQISLLHEELQTRMSQGKYAAARRLAEEILRRKPDYVPVLNNLSAIHFMEGNTAQAVATAHRVLEAEPDNIHALSNLIHFLCSNAQFAEARALASRLKNSQAPAYEGWLKKMEGLSYLDDDAGVRDLFEQVQQTGELDQQHTSPYLLHLAAAAEARLGDVKQAKQHWEQALKIAPGLDAARENLTDARLPIGERHGPWAFELRQWLSPQAGQALHQLLEKNIRVRRDTALETTARAFLQQHPEVIALIPVLLDRVDPEGCQLVTMMVYAADRPELWAALKDFALGQRGSDQLRQEVARELKIKGLLPEGPVPMWLKGEWRAIEIFGFEIYTEPIDQGHSAKVKKLIRQALDATYDDPARAERLLKQALELEPNAPDVLNNLAAVYSYQGHETEAKAIIHEVFEKHPDYFFARTNEIKLLIHARQIDRAQELLQPLLKQQRYHVSEFGALASVQIELCLARKEKEAARSWYEMLQGIDPDSVYLEIYYDRLYGRKLLPWLPR
jgi:tetratricopeptide (TPR) repeat protein